MNKTNKKFLVCSFGGSGSTILTKYLAKFGEAYHIHSRNPPDNLTYPEMCNKSYGYFGNKIIPNNELINYYVIFIYKKPIEAIYSRFKNSHLKHIECKNQELINILNSKKSFNSKEEEINFIAENVASSGKDLYELEDFFNNYTEKKNRNYKILNIYYDDLFKNFNKLNSMLNINDNSALYPIEKKTERNYIDKEKFDKIYESLNNKINNTISFNYT